MIILSHSIEVPLTTVAQDNKEIGRKAAELIVRQVERADTEQHKIIVPVQWVERNSTAVQTGRLSEKG